MLHEAGHTMGLADALAPFTANQTVMNPYDGTNDSNHNMPTDVQPCDDRAVLSIPQYSRNCNFYSGGGGCDVEEPIGGCSENYHWPWKIVDANIIIPVLS